MIFLILNGLCCHVKLSQVVYTVVKVYLLSKIIFSCTKIHFYGQIDAYVFALSSFLQNPHYVLFVDLISYPLVDL